MTISYIDDQDASIKYIGTWTTGGIEKEYQWSVTSSTHVGDSFLIPFHGRYIGVHATIDSSSKGVITSYSIDGGKIEKVITPSVAAADTYDYKLWESLTLPTGNHTLNVTMVKVNIIPDQPSEGTVWFDRFAVDVVNATPTSTSQDISNPSVSPDSTGSGEKEASQHTGAIVGGVIAAGVLILVLLVSGTYWWRRKRKVGSEEFFVSSYRFARTSNRSEGGHGKETIPSSPNSPSSRNMKAGGRIAPAEATVVGPNNQLRTAPHMGSTHVADSPYIHHIREVPTEMPPVYSEGSS